MQYNSSVWKKDEKTFSCVPTPQKYNHGWIVPSA